MARCSLGSVAFQVVESLAEGETRFPSKSVTGGADVSDRFHDLIPPLLVVGDYRERATGDLLQLTDQLRDRMAMA